jgi:hypothetical protein
VKIKENYDHNINHWSILSEKKYIFVFTLCTYILHFVSFFTMLKLPSATEQMIRLVFIWRTVLCNAEVELDHGSTCLSHQLKIVFLFVIVLFFNRQKWNKLFRKFQNNSSFDVGHVGRARQILQNFCQLCL